MAGRRHVVSGVGPARKSQDIDREASPGSLLGSSHHRSSSSTSDAASSPSSSTPTATAAPSLSSSSRSNTRPLQFLSKDKDREPSSSSSFNIKKLQFFGDKDKEMPGTLSRTTSPIPPSLVSSSLAAVSATDMSSPSPSSSTLAPSLSPSKSATSSVNTSSGGRTYDAKLVTREMLRLGSLNQHHHTPNNFTPTLGSAVAALSSSQSSTLNNLTGSAPALTATTSSSSRILSHGGASLSGDGGAWSQLHVHILPLFNHESLQTPVEYLNNLVRKHIESILSRGLNRALMTLEHDVIEFLQLGMITLGTKLSGVTPANPSPEDDAKLLVRVIEIWGFFWTQVLPYVEAIFLPLQTDDRLWQLYRTPKKPASSPSLGLTPLPDESTTNNSQQNLSIPPMVPGLPPIDVWALTLRAFRDSIVFPVVSRLVSRLTAIVQRDNTSPNSVTEIGSHQLQRLQQMLLVLHSQSQRTRPTPNLSTLAIQPPPRLSPPELAIRKLLDALALHRAALAGTLHSSGSSSIHPNASAKRVSNTSVSTQTPRSGTPFVPASVILGLNIDNQSSSSGRPPSFLSAGAPRDRRGRIASRVKARLHHLQTNIRPRPQKIVKRSAEQLAQRRRGRYIDENASGGSVATGGEADDGEDMEEDGQSDEGEDLGEFGDGAWYGDEVSEGEGDADHGGATPRGRFSTSAFVRSERERSRTLLESLRSPGPAEAEDETPFDEEADQTAGDDSDSSEDYDDHGTAKRWNVGSGDAEYWDVPGKEDGDASDRELKDQTILDATLISSSPSPSKMRPES